jgi:hypothetical protein
MQQTRQGHHAKVEHSVEHFDAPNRLIGFGAGTPGAIHPTDQETPYRDMSVRIPGGAGR